MITVTRGKNMTKANLCDTVYAMKTHVPGANVSYVMRMGKLRVTLGKVCRVAWMSSKP